MLQSREEYQKWPTNGRIWLHHPCRLGGPQCFIAGDKIKSVPQVGGLATSLLPSRGSAMLHSRGQNQKWPTNGRIGYITPTI